MESELYQLMNWPEIEDILYSECATPKDILGPAVCREGIVIQAFRPDAVEMWVKTGKGNRLTAMENVDKGGFFACLLPGKKIPAYTLVYETRSGQKIEIEDAYRFAQKIEEKDLKAFQAGVNYDLPDMLGAHLTSLNGVSGVHFAVWAPEAVRVSVVGDFNQWDGRIYQMQKLSDSGIFELFIPGLKEGDLYKFEIKAKGQRLILKADPFAFCTEMRPHTASIVYNRNIYQWRDEDWQQECSQNFLFDSDKKSGMTRPIAIYELHAGSFMTPKDGRQFFNYRELAVKVGAYVTDMGYTHVELMPVNEYPLDESWGYQVTGYYAPTSRYGSPDDFKYFVDYLHQIGIGVILDWVPAHFPKDAFGLAEFDGSCVYEYTDSRMQSHKEWGTLVFDYGKSQVRDFLMCSAIYMVQEYHIDGIRVDAVASMLYRDYGRGPGEWMPNLYGGNENLEAQEFFRHMNSIFKKKNLPAMLIAEESTAWPMVTGVVEKGGLGFDYKWNMGWMNDFINFMKLDPIYRKAHYSELTFSMIYAYSENFILPFSHDEVVHGKGSMLEKMPGDTEAMKMANLRLTYGFQYMHPGKKLNFMGQEFAQHREWSEKNELDWNLLQETEHLQMHDYVRALNYFYQAHPALYEQDYLSDGFEWINQISADETIVVFLRRDRQQNELLVVANFTPVVRKQFQIGVPIKGRYKEIFNSDKAQFGGQDYLNRDIIDTRPEACDCREQSITITVPPLGIVVLEHFPESEQVRTIP